jgi:hypothetical protein
MNKVIDKLRAERRELLREQDRFLHKRAETDAVIDALAKRLDQINMDIAIEYGVQRISPIRTTRMELV